MENIFKQIKNTVLESVEVENVRIIGNGRADKDFISKYKNNVDIIINNGANNTEAIYYINIIKSKRALNELKTKENMLVVLPAELDTDLNCKKVVLKDFEYNGINLVNNPAVLSILIANEFNCNKIMSGYTFDLKIKNSMSLNSKEYNEIYFSKQKEELNKFIKNFNIIRKEIEKELKVETIKDLINRKLKNNETIIVAEITNNHCGSLDTLCKMAKLATEQGADLIKIQKRNVDLFYTEEELKSEYKSEFGNTLREYRNGVELSKNDIIKFNDFCKKENILWFSTILDKYSYEELNDFNFDLIKIPSTVSNHINYLKHVADNFNNDIVISTGATSDEYVKEILDLFYKDNRKMFILHTVSSYPTPMDNVNIGIINYYNKLTYKYPNLIPGYSGHDVGTIGGFAAVLAGAMMVEKHVKFGNNEWIHFDSVASDLLSDDFIKYVEEIKKAEIIRGSCMKKVYSIEDHKYKINSNCN